jgi:hypothetical protein
LRVLSATIVSDANMLGCLQILVLHVVHDTYLGVVCYSSTRYVAGRRAGGMSEAQSENSRARTRSLLWMEALWEGTSTTAREEDRKEEVLSMFRELGKDSRSHTEVREYVPWEALW